MPDHAAMYIADPSLIGSKLFASIVGVRSYEGLSKEDVATGVRFTLDAGEVLMNFMPQSRVEHHLAGFCGFAEQTITNEDRLMYVLSRIRSVRLVCGCVISPGLDEAGLVAQFLFDFNSATNGLLFFANTIFDYDGEVLGGGYSAGS